MITMAKPRNGSSDRAGSPFLGGSERMTLFLLAFPNQPGP